MEIHDEDGAIFTDNDGIDSTFVAYFSTLFTSSINGDVSDITASIMCSISIEEKELLEKPYASEDVKAVFNVMFLEKAPGPDGMIVAFYKKHFSILGNDICQLVLNVLNDGGAIDDINDIFYCFDP